jgi:hypothetical protein
MSESNALLVSGDARLEAWRVRLAEWSESGESGSGYCRRNGLSYDQFKYWLRRIGSSQRPGLTFVRVEARNIQGKAILGGSHAAATSSIRVRAGRHMVEIDSGFSAEDLLVVLRVLERV